jgi:hypothetical protein
MKKPRPRPMTPRRPVTLSPTTRRQLDATLKEVPKKIKITGTARTSSNATVAKGQSMISSAKKVTPTAKPKPKVTKKPMTQAQKESAALDALMKKRAAEAKKTGNWPNYRTN